MFWNDNKNSTAMTIRSENSEIKDRLGEHYDGPIVRRILVELSFYLLFLVVVSISKYFCFTFKTFLAFYIIFLVAYVLKYPMLWRVPANITCPI